MVYISGGCTGTIIGKWHIMSAAHCFDGRRYSSRNRSWIFTNDWEDNKFFWVGTHEKMKIVSGKDPHGQKLERDTGWTVMIWNKTIIEFPLFCKVGCKFSLRPIDEEVTLDVAVLKTKTEIMFFSGHVAKAKLDPPSLNCQTCLDDCDSSITFKGIGWGLRGNFTFKE